MNLPLAPFSEQWQRVAWPPWKAREVGAMFIVRQRSLPAVLAALLLALLFAASGTLLRRHPPSPPARAPAATRTAPTPAPAPVATPVAGPARSGFVGPGLAAPCNPMVGSGP
jgi:hypothetical protein